jgi:peptidoglycan/LPS O-acetylase OafA/YrhL
MNIKILKPFELNNNQSDLLNFLRGSAALLVLIAHVQQILISPTWYPHKELNVDLYLVAYRHLGGFGVMAFFVLSGFLIYLSIANNIYSTSTRKFNIKKYMYSRLMRLYPPLIVSTILCFFIYIIIELLGLSVAAEFSTGHELYIARKDISINWIDTIGSLFFLNTIIPEIKSPSINGPLWSLAHEFWYYIVAAFIIASYKSKLFIIPLFITCCFLYFNVNEFWFYGLFVWFSGFYAAFVYRNKENVVVTYFNVFILVIFFCVWMSMFYYSPESYFCNNRQKFFFGLTLSALLPVLIDSRAFLEKLNHFKFYKLVASVSPYAYTLYLIHFPLLLLTFVILNRFVGNNIFLVMITSLIASVFILKLASVYGPLIENKNQLTLAIKKYFIKQKLGF